MPLPSTRYRSSAPSTGMTPCLLDSTPGRCSRNPSLSRAQPHQRQAPYTRSYSGSSIARDVRAWLPRSRTGVQTTQTYSGTVNISVSGTVQASGCNYSHAFYVYADCCGNPLSPPVHYKLTYG